MMRFEVNDKCIYTLQNIYQKERIAIKEGARPEVYQWNCTVVDHTRKHLDHKTVRVRFDNGMEKCVYPESLTRRNE